MPKRLRQAVVRAADSAPFRRGVALVDRLTTDRSDVLRVLTYHRVDDPEAHPHLDPGVLSATPANFRVQMESIAQRFSPVSIAEVLAAIDGEAELPPRAVLVTFDDAYRCFADHAWPILRALRIPAVVFVPTSFPDQPHHRFWWDLVHQAIHKATGAAVLETTKGRWSLATKQDVDRARCDIHRQVRQLAQDEVGGFVEELCARAAVPPNRNHVLGWEELRQLAEDGVTLAPHTQTHPLLTRVSPERVRDEVAGSLRELEARIGSAPSVFAYPDGVCDDSVAEVVRTLGIKLAFTTQRGLNHLHHDDPLRLRRINVGRHTPLSLLHAQMLPIARAIQLFN